MKFVGAVFRKGVVVIVCDFFSAIDNKADTVAIKPHKHVVFVIHFPTTTYTAIIEHESFFSVWYVCVAIITMCIVYAGIFYQYIVTTLVVEI